MISISIDNNLYVNGHYFWQCNLKLPSSNNCFINKCRQQDVTCSIIHVRDRVHNKWPEISDFITVIGSFSMLLDVSPATFPPHTPEMSCFGNLQCFQKAIWMPVLLTSMSFSCSSGHFFPSFHKKFEIILLWKGISPSRIVFLK